MLRAAEVLPFTADDYHSMRSGQGSFADLLHCLTSFPDHEVRQHSGSPSYAAVVPVEISPSAQDHCNQALKDSLMLRSRGLWQVYMYSRAVHGLAAFFGALSSTPF